MKSLSTLLIVILAPLRLWAEPVSDLLPPQIRAETLTLARTLLATKPMDLTEESLAAMNPFNPLVPVAPGVEAEKGPVQVVETVMVTDRDLLSKLAEDVMPSGMMQLGDRKVLLVGKKKLKVGDRILVNSDSTVYELEVSAIERTTFSLRLKNEEITRLIKAPNKKQ